ncbi:hypothetical protein [Micromonospora zamorensis]|uniref:hypothetical protein n=1 Tax=Micromonospora zamorensis TaxID=709883 RepID=UPI0033C927FD
MTNYDLTRLSELGRTYAEQRAAAEKTRAELTPEILAAARARVKQGDIVRASGLTRERVRQLCRAAGIEPE